MTAVLIKTVQLIAALSLLVAIHEFGHCLFAKIFGTRVEKFYLFFNPGISLVKFKKIGGRWRFRFFSKNEDSWGDADKTEYGIGWVPFGGYCKIAGMVDESMDMEALKAEPQSWEFRTKPAWQRFFIMFGGVLFNFILAFGLYAAILGTWGEEYLKVEDATYGIAVNDLSYEIGFRTGDRIIAIGSEPTDNFALLQARMVRSRATEATVLRAGDTVTVSIDPIYTAAMLNTPGMFTPAVPFIVGELSEDSVNAGADIIKGDRVVSVGGEKMEVFQEIKSRLGKYASGEVELGLVRGQDTISRVVKVNDEGLVGIVLDASATETFKMTTVKYGFFESIPAGAVKLCRTIADYVRDLGLIFSPKTEAYKSVGSFIAIGKIFPNAWDWFKFWTLTALFSVMLGVMNLLPIPGLDGGHILFLLFEMITGRRPSDKFLQVAETIGLILLCALMVLAFGNDIRGLFK